ncbi:MAG: xanthine dehydrogenase accessory protein XdhC [Planctomycetes bacterium]|nr:xanthine dehydrogenase accessory protein XdhC [Planctomycetota bacterium]
MHTERAWFEVLAELRAAGTPCAVVVVTEVKGSTPREVGARLVVAGGELVWGTIGGGKLEHLAIVRASELVATGRARSESAEFPLAEAAGQCCGGHVTLFFEVFPWTARRVVVFGAGHVAQALAGLHGYLGAELELVDPRDEAELVPTPPAGRSWTLTCIDAPEGEVARLPQDALVLVMTHDHALDLAILEALLARGGFPYVGLIGSERKWARFRRRLAARGFTPAQIGSVRCPIGVTKSSKEPAAIAISVAAELLDVMASLGRS